MLAALIVLSFFLVKPILMSVIVGVMFAFILEPVYNKLNKVIKAGESTYCGGKEGGVFIGLKKEMIKRAERLIKKK